MNNERRVRGVLTRCHGNETLDTSGCASPNIAAVCTLTIEPQRRFRNETRLNYLHPFVSTERMINSLG